MQDGALLSLNLTHAAKVIEMAEERTRPDNLSALLDRLAPAEREDLRAVLLRVNDVNTMSLVCLVGRHELREDHLAEGSPAKRSAASLLAWAKQPADPRFAWTLSGTVATTAVTILEAFLVTTGRRLCQRRGIDRFNPRAGDSLDTWITRMRSVGCDIPEELASVLAVLRNERNRFVHDLGPPPLEPGYAGRSAIAIHTWTGAVVWITCNFLDALGRQDS